MFLKVLKFRSIDTVYSRAAYYLSKTVSSHSDLERLHRWFIGVEGLASMRKKTESAFESHRIRPGTNRVYPLFEFIVSSTPGSEISLGEARLLGIALADGLESIGGMVGGHWHRDGRFDMHVLLINQTWGDEALATASRLPATGRHFRNLEVVARGLMDSAHDELNRKRSELGMKRIPTMTEVIDYKIEKRRLNGLVRETKNWTSPFADSNYAEASPASVTSEVSVGKSGADSVGSSSGKRGGSGGASVHSNKGLKQPEIQPLAISPLDQFNALKVAVNIPRSESGRISVTEMDDSLDETAEPWSRIIMLGYRATAGNAAPPFDEYWEVEDDRRLKLKKQYAAALARLSATKSEVRQEIERMMQVGRVPSDLGTKKAPTNEVRKGLGYG